MKKTVMLLMILFPFGLNAEMVKIMEMKSTVGLITKKSVLEVDFADIKKSDLFNPAEQDLPISIKDAINLVEKEYKQKFGNKSWGVASVSLKKFPGQKHSKFWFLQIDVVGDPGVMAAVLFSGKVVFSKEI